MVRRRWALVGVLALAAAWAGAARADEPRTNCHKVKKWSDMMVCGNPDLRDLDGKVDNAYRKAQVGLSPADAGKVRRVQQAWLRGREKCQESADPTKCLHDYYERRIKEIVQPGQ